MAQCTEVSIALSLCTDQEQLRYRSCFLELPFERKRQKTQHQPLLIAKIFITLHDLHLSEIQKHQSLRERSNNFII